MNKKTVNRQYFILTGAMGSGKSTLLRALHNLGYQTIKEPAREIIAEQREIDGEGLYDRDPRLFYYLMLSRAISQYKQNNGSSYPIIWDRGITDNIAYGQLFNLNIHSAQNAAKIYRSNDTVFFLPAWEEIYTNDVERKMSYLDAKRFGEMVRKAYETLGYQLIDIPFDTPEKRAQFVLDIINEIVT